MKRAIALAALSVTAGLPGISRTAEAEPMQVGFLWHMHQPIYYPGESVVQTDANNRFSYSVTDIHNQRFGPYTTWPKDAVTTGSGLPNLGAQVSFTGSLMQNLNDLRDNNTNGGMWNFWDSSYRQGRAMTTALGNPRIDMVGFGYAHPLMPLMDTRDMRMQIQMHKYEMQQTFGSSVPYSKGFFPAETAFSERMIPALVAEGLQWTIVDNIHIDRASKNYPHTNASGLFAPNKADQLNDDPAATGGSWVQLNNLWAPSKVGAPNSYRPAYVQYTDPNSGTTSKIVAVPAARYEGNEDGRGGYGAFLYQTVMDQYRQYNTDPARPMFVVLHHDGDNYGGGSDSYYHSNFQSMVNWANGNANYNVTTIQDYLQKYPVPQNAVIHVENGSWAGADNGDPEFKKWLGDPNASGWSPDRNSWAVLTAAKNRVFTAEDIQPITNVANVVHGTGNTTEKAWHYLTQAEASDYWYWDGTEIWDSNVTRGSNLAVAQADQVINSFQGVEHTPPAVFVPQRDAYNPGNKEFGTTAESSDFKVWTYAYDTSGIAACMLKWRIDGDGLNPLSSTQNETFVGGGEVGAWQNVAMTSSDMNRPSNILAPTYRALQYSGQIAGQSNVLVDYYVEAVDGNGNITKSDIQHVWVGASTTGGGTGGNGGGTTAFTMDGQLDAAATQSATNNGINLYTAVRDGRLYIATTDAGEGNDHFVFIARQPGAMVAAPWAKAGQASQWDVMLADENDNSFAGWFNSTGGLGTAGANGSGTGVNGGVLEGFIDLAGQWGSYPEELYVAIGLYGNADGGALLATHQVPASVNGDGNLDATEYVKITLPQPEWTGSSTGNWSNKQAWILDTVPNGAGMTAKLYSRATTGAAVTLDQNVTLNRLELDNPQTYQIVAGSTPTSITFAGTSAKAIDVLSGGHVVDVQLNFAKDAQISVASNSFVRLTKTISAPTRVITKTGLGKAEIHSIQARSLVVSKGTLAIIPGVHSASKVEQLTIASDAKLDLNNSALILPATATLNGTTITVDRLRQLIINGRGGIGTSSATWAGAGGVGTSAFTDVSADSIGYAWNADPRQLSGVVPSVNGQPIGADEYAVKFTAAADASLDGVVDDTDVAVIGLSYDRGATAGHHWYEGDFNYDGLIDDDDVAILGLGYAPSATPLTPMFYASASENFSATLAAPTLIPEPAALALIALPAMAQVRRRRVKRI